MEASPQFGLVLDQACLKRCSFPATGASGDDLAGLPDVLRVLYGLKQGCSGTGSLTVLRSDPVRPL
jgi:hypothetical protein